MHRLESIAPLIYIPLPISSLPLPFFSRQASLSQLCRAGAGACAGEGEQQGRVRAKQGRTSSRAVWQPVQRRVAWVGRMRRCGQQLFFSNPVHRRSLSFSLPPRVSAFFFCTRSLPVCALFSCASFSCPAF
jgi:hypothetical protein